MSIDETPSMFKSDFEAKEYKSKKIVDGTKCKIAIEVKKDLSILSNTIFIYTS